MPWQVCRDTARLGLGLCPAVRAAPAKQEADYNRPPTLLFLYSSLILGYSSSQAPAAKPHLKKRFGEEKEVAEPLDALRAMTVMLTAEPWSF